MTCCGEPLIVSPKCTVMKQTGSQHLPQQNIRRKPRNVPNSRKLPLFYLVFFVVMIMSCVGVEKQHGNIVKVRGNFPANVGLHKTYTINSFLNVPSVMMLSIFQLKRRFMSVQNKMAPVFNIFLRDSLTLIFSRMLENFIAASTWRSESSVMFQITLKMLPCCE